MLYAFNINNNPVNCCAEAICKVIQKSKDNEFTFKVEDYFDDCLSYEIMLSNDWKKHGLDSNI